MGADFDFFFNNNETNSDEGNDFTPDESNLVDLSSSKTAVQKKLSPRQQELLEYIEKVSNSEHRMPSYREMASALKLSAVGSVQDLLRVLIAKNYLQKNGKHLTLSRKRQSPVLHVPIVGVVAAGSLTPSFENQLGVLTVSSQLLNSKKAKNIFALRVQGQSMIDAGIFEGDFVFVSPKESVKSGDTVVVRTGEETTVKEIYFKSKSITLRPRNSKMSDMHFDENASKELDILGRVVLLQRTF